LNQGCSEGIVKTVPSTKDDVTPGDGYEPPRIEQVMTPAELTREIQYAGDITAITGD